MARTVKVRRDRSLILAGVIIASVVLGSLGLHMFFRSYRTPSGSMIPTLLVGDHVWVAWHWSPPPHRGDVVVFRLPENRSQEFFKRIVGVPGDVIEVLDGRPIINGQLAPTCHVGAYPLDGRTAQLYLERLGDAVFGVLHDDLLDQPACAVDGDCAAGLACRAHVCGQLQGPYRVLPGEVWVLGDNRNNSHDSRSWRGGLGGGVPFDDVEGTPRKVWVSLAPGGGTVSERSFIGVKGPPTLPAGLAGALGPAMEKCLRALEPDVTVPPDRR